MSMRELQDKRREFVQAVQNAVAEDLEKNGLELESVSLTSMDQTAKEFFNPSNAFDAEGLTRLTEETESRRKQRNDIEQDTEVQVRTKNLEAERLKRAPARSRGSPHQRGPPRERAPHRSRPYCQQRRD
jgi:uncharacterized membrane protein YqiK